MVVQMLSSTQYILRYSTLDADFNGYFDEQWWQCAWSFLAGACMVGMIWAWQILRNLLPDNITVVGDDSLWVEPWTALRTRTWRVIVENTPGIDTSNSVSVSAPGHEDNDNTSTRRRFSSSDFYRYYQKHIGELPAPKAPRNHWPWETIRKRVFSSTSLGPGKTSHDSDDDSDHINEHSRATESQSSTAVSHQSSFETADDFDSELDENAAGIQQSSKKEICIGSIFGLDVGGTLAKLIYFEQKPSDYDPLMKPSLDRHRTMAASAQVVSMARSTFSANNIASEGSTCQGSHVSTSVKNPVHANASLPSAIHECSGSQSVKGKPVTTRRRSLSLGCLGRFKEIQRQYHEEQQTGISSSSPLSPSSSAWISHSPSFDQYHLSNLTSDQSRNNLDTKSPKQQLSEGDYVSSQLDLEHLKELRQEVVPDDLDLFRNAVHFEAKKSALHKERNHQSKDLNGNSKENSRNESSYETESKRVRMPAANYDDLREAKSSTSKMKKSRSMFNLSPSQKKAEALDRFYSFARRLDSYENSVRDDKLSFYSRELGGEFHFIHFESRWMKHAMDLILYHNLHLNIAKMGATGGGAHKYAEEWDKMLGIKMDKQEELDSLVAGMQFVLATVVGECYTFRPKIAGTQNNTEEDPRGSTIPSVSVCDENDCKPNMRSDNDVLVDDHQVGAPLIDASFDDDGSEVGHDVASSESKKSLEFPEKADEVLPVEESKPNPSLPPKPVIDERCWSRKIQRDTISYSTSYPYLLVTIGTGVSILRVDGPRKHERISGSSIGGGTYWGLIRLLTDMDDFEGVMRLAEKGDQAKVDMMVGDIYGENSDALEKLGLPSNIVASSFGKLVAKDDPAMGLQQEDLARALLLMITNNIGQVAYLNAKLHKTPRIYFVGNFLRRNMISQRRLSYAIDYWSKGEMEALFLEHEGYFGALGAFLMSQQISQDGEGFFQWGDEGEGETKL